MRRSKRLRSRRNVKKLSLARFRAYGAKKPRNKKAA